MRQLKELAQGVVELSSRGKAPSNISSNKTKSTSRAAFGSFSDQLRQQLVQLEAAVGLRYTALLPTQPEPAVDDKQGKQGRGKKLVRSGGKGGKTAQEEAKSNISDSSKSSKGSGATGSVVAGKSKRKQQTSSQQQSSNTAAAPSSSNVADSEDQKSLLSPQQQLLNEEELLRSLIPTFNMTTGSVANLLKCPHCGYKRSTNEPFRAVTLNIPIKRVVSNGGAKNGGSSGVSNGHRSSSSGFTSSDLFNEPPIQLEDLLDEYTRVSCCFANLEGNGILVIFVLFFDYSLFFVSRIFWNADAPNRDVLRRSLKLCIVLAIVPK